MDLDARLSVPYDRHEQRRFRHYSGVLSVHRPMLLVVVLLSLLATSCGGGGSSKGSKNPGVPDLALFFVSGHPKSGDPAPYLEQDAGPDILSALQSAGFTSIAGYYVDDAFSVNGVGGYLQLVQDLQMTRDQWVSQGTRVIVVAHSHGGVWAHAAVAAVSNLTITCEVDLDVSSYGWSLVGHDAQNSYIGGDPRDEFYIPYLVYYSQYPSVPSDQSSYYDLEDVVLTNVVSNLEVRSGDSPDGIEWYDEKWSIRSDATVDGLFGYYSGTSHEEVHAVGGTTLNTVKSWLLTEL